jgi:hypothetical protein
MQIGWLSASIQQGYWSILDIMQTATKEQPTISSG